MPSFDGWASVSVLVPFPYCLLREIILQHDKQPVFLILIQFEERKYFSPDVHFLALKMFHFANVAV
jgi:hypothetical protein